MCVRVKRHVSVDHKTLTDECLVSGTFIKLGTGLDLLELERKTCFPVIIMTCMLLNAIYKLKTSN